MRWLVRLMSPPPPPPPPAPPPLPLTAATEWLAALTPTWLANLVRPWLSRVALAAVGIYAALGLVGGFKPAAPGHAAPQPGHTAPQAERNRSRSVEMAAALRDPTTNPFTNPSLNSPSLLQRVKESAMVPVAILRLLLVFCVVVAGSTLVKLALLGHPHSKLASEPLSGPRRLAVALVVRCTTRLMLFSLGYVWVSVEGAPAGATEAPVVVANHTCMIDPFVLSLFFVPAPVGAVEQLNLPLVGTFARAIQTVTVDRRDPNSRHAVVETIKARARSGGRWPHTLLFPEGTTTNARALITFKPGAFLPGVPVQPCVITFPRPAHGLHPGWVNPHGAPYLVWRICLQPVNRVHVRFLPVYSPSAAEVASPSLFASNVRERMAEAMGVPCTQHSFDDVRLQAHASAVGEPGERPRRSHALARACVPPFPPLSHPSPSRRSYTPCWRRRRGRGADGAREEALRRRL